MAISNPKRKMYLAFKMASHIKDCSYGKAIPTFTKKTSNILYLKKQ